MALRPTPLAGGTWSVFLSFESRRTSPSAKAGLYKTSAFQIMMLYVTYIELEMTELS